jgi:hypothetical protein
MERISTSEAKMTGKTSVSIPGSSPEDVHVTPPKPAIFAAALSNAECAHTELHQRFL